MHQYVQLECPYCQSEDLVKHGHSESGLQRYRCKDCRRSFQWEYLYPACVPGVKEQIITQTLNSRGVNDVSRNLGISKPTVIAELKRQEPTTVNLAYAEYVTQQGGPGLEVELRAEADEFWSFVGDKSNQRWTWYALDRATGIILAHQNGRRLDEICQQLLQKLEVFPISMFYTDNWQSYAKLIPAERHCIGKKDTWKIERANLNFRTHLKRLHRKTICFSKHETIHDNVIGLYIEQEYYKNTSYAEVA